MYLQDPHSRDLRFRSKMTDRVTQMPTQQRARTSRTRRLPRLALDPDARLVRWGWIAWGAFTVLIALRWITFGGGAPKELQWVSLAHIAALWLLWPLVRGVGALWRWMRAAPHAAWNGSYYEFDGRQMRLLFDDDDIFVVASDVFAALDLRGRVVGAERVRLISGKDGLRHLPGRRELVFSERGLSAWLARRNDAKAISLRRWFERDVLAPHRKRREIQSGVIRNSR